MLFVLIGLGTNCVLAPILIIGYFGAPRLEVAGAGYAAVIGQCVGLSIALLILFGKKHLVNVSFKGFRLRFEIIRDILVVGAPSIVMQAVMPLVISFLNKLLFSYGSAVFVLGVYYRISTFAILPVLGLNQGALPIMGYNFGAKNRLRLLQTFKSAFKVAMCIMIVSVAIFWIFPVQIMTLFSASEGTMNLGVHALRVISVSWLPGAFVIIAIGLFQALAHGMFALIISIVRQIGFIMPLAWILLTYIGLNAVWYSYPLAEIASFTLAVLFFRRTYAREIKLLPDGAPVSGKLPGEATVYD
jgi:Na+-driven multidrug efflux pump